jgi:hypothetical protein
MDALGAIRVDSPTKLLSDAPYPTDTRPRRTKGGIEIDPDSQHKKAPATVSEFVMCDTLKIRGKC